MWCEPSYSQTVTISVIASISTIIYYLLDNSNMVVPNSDGYFTFVRMISLYSVATTPVVVTSNQPACPGEPVAVQCTLGGRILTWNTPEGALILIRGRQEEGDSGPFHWTLQELDASTLQSTLTFSTTTEIAIGCSNGTESSSASVQVEGELDVVKSSTVMT